MFLPKKINVDRLHDTIEQMRAGGTFNLGEGRSTAYVYLMFGEVELGDPSNHYLYVTDNEMWAKHVARAFLSLVEQVHPEMGILPKHMNFFPTMIILPHGQRFLFLGVDTFLMPQTLMGSQFNRVFLDVSEVMQDHLDYADTKLQDALQYLLVHGVDVV